MGRSKKLLPQRVEVSSIIENCPNIAAFATLLSKHAAVGNCLLKGMVTKPLVTESRKDSTARNATTEFLCLDIDGLNPIATVDDVLDDMGLGKVSYILQWSGSMGISNNDLRCHVFIMLAKPVSAPLIKQWLIQKNHETPILRNHQTLTKTGNSLSWGLDITACQSDKLIYIAPPVLNNIRNPLGKKPRISSSPRLLPPTTWSSIISTTRTVLSPMPGSELRDAAGLPKRKLQYKTVGAHEVLVKPVSALPLKSSKTAASSTQPQRWRFRLLPPREQPLIHNFKAS